MRMPLVILVCLMNSGCVIATRHDFELIKKAEHSLGYVEGLSYCGEVVVEKETRGMVR